MLWCQDIARGSVHFKIIFTNNDLDLTLFKSYSFHIVNIYLFLVKQL